MGNGKLYSSYSQLPTWAKGVVATLGIGTIIVSGFLIYKGVKVALTKSSPSSQQAQDDLKVLSNQGVRPSYPDTQFSSWAEQLHEALKFTFTDEDAVYRVFGFMKNDADVIKLIQAYGLRPEIGTTFVSWFDTDMTLPQQIGSAMTTDEIAEINKILASKRIKFRF